MMRDGFDWANTIINGLGSVVAITGVIIAYFSLRRAQESDRKAAAAKLDADRAAAQAAAATTREANLRAETIRSFGELSAAIKLGDAESSSQGSRYARESSVPSLSDVLDEAISRLSQDRPDAAPGSPATHAR